MTELEDLDRALREARTHIQALEQALAEGRKELVEVRAKVVFVSQRGAETATQLKGVIDTLWARIEAMADAWEAQLRTHVADDAKCSELLAVVAPFRPERLGDAVVAGAPAPKGEA